MKYSHIRQHTRKEKLEKRRQERLAKLEARKQEWRKL